MGNVWTVPAYVERVVDADTYALALDLGWNITRRDRCRLAGINAPEMSTEEGKAARAHAVALLEAIEGKTGGVGTLVTFVSHSLDKYGRPLGQILATSPQGVQMDLSEALLSAGHAVPMR